MKKALSIFFAFLFLFSVACAESVTRQEFRLSYKDESIDGFYTGNLENGQPEGFGVFEAESPDGTSCHYIGDWTGGLMNGQGATYWSDGSVEIGEYKDGQFISGKYNYNGLQMIKATKSGDTTINRFWISTVVSRTGGRTSTDGLLIGNKNSKVYHRPDCDSVREMKEKNKREFESAEEAAAAGYKPCGRCNPPIAEGN